MSKRNSSIELLRIIAMTFIVIGHISIHAQKGETVLHNAITSITITGVNIFLLITGYFGLKLKWKSYLNIVGLVVFYSILSIILDFIIYECTPSLEQIVLATITPPFGHTTYWFASCYIILMLLSPALNIIREKASDKQFIFITSTLVMLTCITGFILKNQINISGYCTMQFITMYFIGGTISRFKIPTLIDKWKFLGIYLIATIVLYILCILSLRHTQYNNPIIIIAAIALFCFILQIKFQSNTINKIASFMFPVYLIQEGHFGFNIYKTLYNYGTAESFCSAKYFITLGIYVLALFVSAFIFESIRQFVMRKPIDAACSYLEKRFNIFDNI